MIDTAEHMDVVVRDERPERIEIGLAVGDHRDHRCRREHGLGRLRGFDPGARLLFHEKPLLVGLFAALVRHLRFGPRPHRAADQPEAFAMRSIDSNHRMQQEAAADALADQTRIAAAAVRRPKGDFAGVLDGQHVPPRGSRRRLLAPSGDDLGNSYPRVAQQAPKTDLDLFPAVRQAAQAAGLQLHHTVEKHHPPFSRRQSPNRPRLRSMPHPLAECAGTAIIKPPRAGSPRSAGDPMCRNRFVHTLARRRGRQCVGLAVTN